MQHVALTSFVNRRNKIPANILKDKHGDQLAGVQFSQYGDTAAMVGAAMKDNGDYGLSGNERQIAMLAGRIRRYIEQRVAIIMAWTVTRAPLAVVVGRYRKMTFSLGKQKLY